MVYGELHLKMHVHLPEANFGKLRIWRPNKILCRYENYEIKVAVEPIWEEDDEGQHGVGEQLNDGMRNFRVSSSFSIFINLSNFGRISRIPVSARKLRRHAEIIWGARGSLLLGAVEPSSFVPRPRASYFEPVRVI